MAVDFTIKQHDQLPELVATLTDALSDVVNVTGATVRFIMTNKATTIKVLDVPATVVDAPAGIVKYTWQDGDTDVAATYNAEFEVKFSDGRVESFPNSKYIAIKVFADLGGIGV